MARPDVRILTQTFEWLPPELLELYADPTRHPTMEYIRLMPPQEAISETKSLEGISSVFEKVIWAWTDDNSNYLGVCLEEPLKGWIIVLNHDGDSEVPYFRSIGYLMSYFRNNPDECSLEGEFPLEGSSPHLEENRAIVKHFKKRCQEETDSEKAGKLATVAIRLTPFEDTEEVIDFLSMDDMWAPSQAISLLRKRGFKGGFKQMEDLASDGNPNGNWDAIYYLKDFAPKESLLRVRDRLIKRHAESSQRDRRGTEQTLEQLKCFCNDWTISSRGNRSL